MIIIMGYIGEGTREIELEPIDLPEVEPVREPSKPEPAQPEREPEPVPA